jgi:DNA polymerase V
MRVRARCTGQRQLPAVDGQQSKAVKGCYRVGMGPLNIRSHRNGFHSLTVLTQLKRIKLFSRFSRSANTYQKAGATALLNLMPAGQSQLSLFSAEGAASSVSRDRLLEVMDRINRDMGRETLWTAAQGLTAAEREDSWRMQRGSLSPAYTTRWEELPRVKAG